MPEPAISQVEDRLGVVLAAFPALAGQTIVTDATPEEQEEADTIIIYTTAYTVAQSDEFGATVHTATIDFEIIGEKSLIGTVSRANQRVAAHIVAAIAQDRTLGGMLEDIQEADVAPVEANGRDIAAASLRTQVTFYTPRDDWFTIVDGSGNPV